MIATPLKGAGIDPVYEGKARVLNNAIQDIGMGRYQWQLFIVVGGFGWASDNLWPIVTSLILPAITSEFKPSKPPLLSLSQNIGLLVGAIFWGFGCMILFPAGQGSADFMQATYSAAGWLSISPLASPPSSDSLQRAPPTSRQSAASLRFGVSGSAGICQSTPPSSSNSFPAHTNTSSLSSRYSGLLPN